MTEPTRRPAAVVYDRVAAIYDLCTAPMEALGGRRPADGCSAGAGAGSWNWASAPG